MFNMNGLFGHCWTQSSLYRVKLLSCLHQQPPPAPRQQIYDSAGQRINKTDMWLSLLSLSPLLLFFPFIFAVVSHSLSFCFLKTQRDFLSRLSYSVSDHDRKTQPQRLWLFVCVCVCVKTLAFLSTNSLFVSVLLLIVLVLHKHTRTHTHTHTQTNYFCP